MPAPVEYDLLYLFRSPQGCLAKIRSNAAVERDFAPGGGGFWLWMEARSVTRLHYLSRATSPLQEREFEEGLFWFDADKGELRWRRGGVLKLTRRHLDGLTPACGRRIEQYFEQQRKGSAKLFLRESSTNRDWAKS
jgi:hypothetical protein